MERHSSIVMPGPEGWERWSSGSRPQPIDNPDGAAAPNARLCIPASRARCLPLWVRSTDQSVMEQVVKLQLEKRRIEFGSKLPGRQFDCQVVAEQGAQRQVEISVIEDESPIPDGAAGWNSFTVSPRMYEYTPNRLAIWRELGKLVAAFSRGNRLAYYHPLGAGNLGEDEVHELACLRQELEGKGFIQGVEGVELWDLPSSRHLESLFEKEFGVKVQQRTRPQPNLKDLRPSALLPGQVAVAQLEKRSQARQMGILATALAGVLILIAAAVGDLYWNAHLNQTRANRLQERQPDAALVETERTRWNELARAVNPDLYPVEIFNRVASHLPEKGMRFTHFEVKDYRIHIEVEAVPGELALAFLSDVTKPGNNLSDWDWGETLQPRFLDNNRRALLTLSATYKDAPIAKE